MKQIEYTEKQLVVLEVLKDVPEYGLQEGFAILSIERIRQDVGTTCNKLFP